MSSNVPLRAIIKIIAGHCHDKMDINDLQSSGTGYYYAVRKDKEKILRNTLVISNDVVVGFILVLRAAVESVEPLQPVIDDRYSYARHPTEYLTDEQITNGYTTIALFHKRFNDDDFLICASTPMTMYGTQCVVYNNYELYDNMKILAGGGSLNFSENCRMKGTLKLSNEQVV